jgi:HSP20 family protein
MAKRGTELAISKGKLERMPRVADPRGRSPRAASPLGDIDRLFEAFFGRRWPTLGTGMERVIESSAFGPNVDIVDRDDDVLVRAELPGFKKDDIDVSVSGNTLTLKGETESEEHEEKGEYYWREISRGSFLRTIELPAEVDDSKARASMKDGMLELLLPKREKSRRRSITIS